MNLINLLNLIGIFIPNIISQVIDIDNHNCNVDKGYIKSILTQNFSVSNVPRSDVLQLSFISSNPKISQLALKSIIDSYQRYEVDSKIQITNYANSKITDRLKELVKQMDIAEKRLAH